MADDDDERAAAEYIHGMAKELGTLAATADLEFLAYLLAMVEQEALRASKGNPGAPGVGRS
jgi:hypothetical protein